MMDKTDIIPCSMPAGLQKKILAYADALIAAAPSIGEHGMDAEEFRDSGIFESAIEKLRGRRSASMAEKKQFIESALARMKRHGRIANFEFTGADALVEAQRVIADLAREAAAGDRAAERRAAAGLAELDAEIGRIVDAIAAVGISPALQARLQAAESERATIASSAAAIGRQRAGIDVARALRAYREEVLRIDEALNGDRDAARAMLVDLLGRITIEQHADGQVWAVAEMNAPALLMLAGAKMGSVAGARNRTQRRIRIV